MQMTDERGYKNYYGIAWCGKPIEDMKYARQMGYDYIAINPSYNPKEYHKNPTVPALNFISPIHIFIHRFYQGIVKR